MRSGFSPTGTKQQMGSITAVASNTNATDLHTHTHTPFKTSIHRHTPFRLPTVVSIKGTKSTEVYRAGKGERRTAKNGEEEGKGKCLQ